MRIRGERTDNIIVPPSSLLGRRHAGQAVDDAESPACRAIGPLRRSYDPDLVLSRKHTGAPRVHGLGDTSTDRKSDISAIMERQRSNGGWLSWMRTSRSG